MAKNEPVHPAPGGEIGRLNLSVPKSLIAAFQQEAARLDVGGSKVAGTLAISAYMGMPETYRKALYFWAQGVRYDEQRDVTADEVWRKLASLVKSEANVRPVGGADTTRGRAAPPGVEITDSTEPTHFVDRIVDPALKKSKKTGTGG